MLMMRLWKKQIINFKNLCRYGVFISYLHKFYFIMKKYFKIIFFYTFLGFIPDIINNLSEYFFNISIPISNEFVDRMGHTKIIVLTVVIGPIIETFFFQTAFFKGLLHFKFFKDNMFLIVLLSASFFALVHYYSIAYIVFAFYGGIILALCYSAILKESNNHKTASIITVIIHSLRNFIIFLIVNVFHLL